MATYVEIEALSRSAVLLAKVTVSASIAANAIRSEPYNIPNHPARARWATSAAINPQAHAQAMMFAVLGNTDIQSGGEATPDATVQYVVDVLVDTFAQ